MKSSLIPLLMLEFVLATAAENAAAPGHFSKPRGMDRYDTLIVDCSRAERLNPRFVKALIETESDFAPDSVSPDGAVGLMQVMPDTAQAFGVEPAALDKPGPNLRAGTAFLDQLFRTARRRYGIKAASLSQAPLWVQQRVLAAYYGGPSMLYRAHWPPKTRHYVKRVMTLCTTQNTLLRIPFDARTLPASGGATLQHIYDH